MTARDAYDRRQTVPGTPERLATIRPQERVQCCYCNKRLVLGASSIMAHEQFCQDKAAAERQQERAKDRFRRKQAGYA